MDSFAALSPMDRAFDKLDYEGRTTNGHVTPNMVFDFEWRARPEAVLRPVSHPVPPPYFTERHEDSRMCA